MNDDERQETLETPPEGEPTSEPQEGKGEETNQDLDEVVNRLAEKLRETQQPKAAEQPPQLSQEEVDRMLRVFKPDRTHLEALRAALEGNDEAGLRFLNDLSRGIYEQAAMAAALMVESLRRQQLEPLAATLQQLQEQKIRNDFFSLYPDLKPFEPLVESVAEKLFASGWKGSIEEGFRLVADQTKQILSRLPGATGNTNNRAPSSKMSALMGAGPAGAGDSKRRQLPPGMEVFLED